MTISNLTLASRTATTLSVTWSAGYPKCYSFTVSHSTQDGSINVTQPANSDTSHTLTSLQPGTTYRIEVEAVRKGDRADGQRAKVMENFTTEGKGYSQHVQLVTSHSLLSTWEEVRLSIVWTITSLHILFSHVPTTDTIDVVPSGTIIPATASTALPARPSASSGTAGELCRSHLKTCICFFIVSIQALLPCEHLFDQPCACIWKCWSIICLPSPSNK